MTFAAWVLITGIALALHADPAGHGTHTQLGLAACPSAFLLNRPCPGCGMTTSWTALIHGDLAHSLQAHPLGPLAYAGFTLVAFLALYAAITERRIAFEETWPHRALVLFAVVFFGYSAFRFATTPDYNAPREDGLSKGVIGRPIIR